MAAQFLNYAVSVPAASADVNGNYDWIRISAGQPSEMTGLQVFGNLDMSAGIAYGAVGSEWADANLTNNQQLTIGAANTIIVGTFVPTNGLGAGAHLNANAAGAITNGTAGALNVNVGALMYVYNAGAPAANPPVPGVATDLINVQLYLNGAAIGVPVLTPDTQISNSPQLPTLLILRANIPALAAAAVLTLVSTNVTTPTNNLIFQYVDFAAQVRGAF